MLSWSHLHSIQSSIHITDQSRLHKHLGEGSPLYSLYRYVPRQRVLFFKLFWSEIWYQFQPFWSEKGQCLCTLVLNWVCFLEELATSSSFGDENFCVFFIHMYSLLPERYFWSSQTRVLNQFRPSPFFPFSIAGNAFPDIGSVRSKKKKPKKKNHIDKKSRHRGPWYPRMT